MPELETLLSELDNAGNLHFLIKETTTPTTVRVTTKVTRFALLEYSNIISLNYLAKRLDSPLDINKRFQVITLSFYRDILTTTGLSYFYCHSRYFINASHCNLKFITQYQT